MKRYDIRHKTQKNLLLAADLSMEAAEKWVQNFNPNMWMDKTLKREDLVIVEEDPAKPKKRI